MWFPLFKKTTTKEKINEMNKLNNIKQKVANPENINNNSSKHPELIRQNSYGTLEHCAICLDKSTKGLKCERGHFIFHLTL